MKQVICKVDDIEAGKMKQFRINNREIVLARKKGNEFYAMHGLCPHQGAKLGLGLLCGTNLPSDVGEYCFGKKGAIVRCPWHNHEFDITTGTPLDNPKKKLKNYSIEIQGDDVWIDV